MSKNKKVSIKLTERFINGLKDYGITYEEIISGKWTYCGGDEYGSSHLKYWKLCCPNQDLPEHFPWCVCGQALKHNCYITDGPTILIIGNCCIKRFMPISGRTCERCGAEHKNRADNKCNECRKKNFCKDCDKEIPHTYRRCYQCFSKWRQNKN